MAGKELVILVDVLDEACMHLCIGLSLPCNGFAENGAAHAGLHLLFDCFESGQAFNAEGDMIASNIVAHSAAEQCNHCT